MPLKKMFINGDVKVRPKWASFSKPNTQSVEIQEKADIRKTYKTQRTSSVDKSPRLARDDSETDNDVIRSVKSVTGAFSCALKQAPQTK